jgi:hypothetical protein
LSEQGESGFRFSITCGADNNERAFSEAFRLEPCLAASAAVFRRGEFGNNAFELVIRAGLKERSSVASELFAEQKRGFTRNKLFQLRPSLRDPCRSNAADQKSTGLGDEAANELLI